MYLVLGRSIRIPSPSEGPDMTIADESLLPSITQHQLSSTLVKVNTDKVGDKNNSFYHYNYIIDVYSTCNTYYFSPSEFCQRLNQERQEDTEELCSMSAGGQCWEPGGKRAPEVRRLMHVLQYCVCTVHISQQFNQIYVIIIYKYILYFPLTCFPAWPILEMSTCRRCGERENPAGPWGEGTWSPSASSSGSTSPTTPAVGVPTLGATVRQHAAEPWCLYSTPTYSIAHIYT